VSQIFFFSEKTKFQPAQKNLLRSWLLRCAKSERKKIASLNYIFCSDKYLRSINKNFLKHDYFTDIITFPDETVSIHEVSGDVFISIDRIRENARTYGVKVSDELHRVMAHGLLHLCGYSDKSESQTKLMRRKENACLKRR
jgi:rRNA maturation RNase YbeY